MHNDFLIIFKQLQKEKTIELTPITSFNTNGTNSPTNSKTDRNNRRFVKVYYYFFLLFYFNLSLY